MEITLTLLYHETGWRSWNCGSGKNFARNCEIWEEIGKNFMKLVEIEKLLQNKELLKIEEC